MTTAYTHGALILSLCAQVAHDLVGSTNAFVTGAMLSSFTIVSALVSILAKPLRARSAVTLGAIASAAGMALLAAAVAEHALPVFLLATAASGAGYGLLVLGGLQIITAAAPMQQQGGVLSALYLLVYLSMGAVALAIGVTATAWGLAPAVDLGACAIALLSLATLGLAATTHRIASRSP